MQDEFIAGFFGSHTALIALIDNRVDDKGGALGSRGLETSFDLIAQKSVIIQKAYHYYADTLE